MLYKFENSVPKLCQHYFLEHCALVIIVRHQTSFCLAATHFVIFGEQSSSSLYYSSCKRSFLVLEYRVTTTAEQGAYKESVCRVGNT